MNYQVTDADVGQLSRCWSLLNPPLLCATCRHTLYTKRYIDRYILRMNKYCLLLLNRYSLLNPSQSGFRKKHSCQISLTNFVDQWLTNINNDEFNGVIFIGLKKKAFAVIDHNLLLRKLARYWMSNCVMELFRSYLNNRKQGVHVGNRTSSLSTLVYGISQGSVLGPMLFPLNINKFPSHINAWCKLFADDAFLHNHHTDLNTLRASLQNSLEVWLIGLKWITWPYIQTK